MEQLVCPKQKRKNKNHPNVRDKDIAGEDHQPDEGKLILAGMLCIEVAPNRELKDSHGVS